MRKPLLGPGSIQIRISFLAALVVVVTGCVVGGDTVLSQDALFSLDLGRLEDQVDLLTRDGAVSGSQTELAIHEGLIYIADGAAGKIMEFTSFGELIRLIYHPEDNPEPVTLRISDDGTGDLTRVASQYRFRQLGPISVDTRRHIYAVDRLSPERSVTDSDLDVELNRIVVRFDDSGNPLDYIGQEGIGGTPFPHVERLSTTVRDELAVVSTTAESKFFHLFHPDGDLMYSAEVRRDRLPIVEDGRNHIIVLQEVVPAVDAYRVYLLVSYYQPVLAEDTGEESGIRFDRSRIYWIDLETGRYEGFIELPMEAPAASQPLHYELAGVVVGERLLLMARQGTGQTRLVVMDDAGRVLRRRVLSIPEESLVLRRLAVDHEGVLAAFLGYEDSAELVWWRADRMIRGAVNAVGTEGSGES